jgi:pimeloyl-ACP methyl ester carboxylesterase
MHAFIMCHCHTSVWQVQGWMPMHTSSSIQHSSSCATTIRSARGSEPNAADDLDGARFENTTQNLVDDLDILCVFFGVERLHVMGHSWY